MTVRERFWSFVHNCVAHPIEGVTDLLLGRQFEWIETFHNWTAVKAYGQQQVDEWVNTHPQ